jgi:arylsulfatase A-like enzyme
MNVIKRKEIQFFAFGLFLIFIYNGCSLVSKEKPLNMIIFLVDDMGLMDTSVPFLTDEYGTEIRYPLNDFYKTPNMESLAKTGIRFTNFYAHSVCSPSRVSILTGQNSARHKVTNWINPSSNNRNEFGPSEWNWSGLTKNSITLPRILHENGYKTIHVGKAHFGPFGSEGENPLNLGFDINIGGGANGQPGSYYGKDGFGNIKGAKKNAVKGLEEYYEKDIFLTEALTLEAKKEISNAKKEGKPFFLNLAHYAVHSPFQADARFIENYKNSGKSEKEIAFATLIEGIDKSLGDIIDHIKELELGENTIILFLGDNGSDAPISIVDDYSSSYPLKGKKGNHWEGGMRIPFIVSWISPNSNSSIQNKLPIANNAIQNQMGSILDIFPSLIEMTNYKYSSNHIIDGYNLKDQFSGKKNKNRAEFFLNHFPHKHRTNYFTSLVNENWKIVYHYQTENLPKYELYNLKTDPFESKDLAKKKLEQLKIMMQFLIDELEDKKALYPEIGKKVLGIIPI